MEGAPDVLDGPAFWKGGDAFNNAMLLPSVWCDEYIWSFQTGVNEYFYGDTIAVNCFPVWRFKRRDRDTVFKCSVSLWASLSEGLLVLGLRMDAIEGPLDAVPLEKLMASPKGGGGYDVEEEPLPVVLDGVDTSSSHLLSDVERQVYGRRILRLAGSRLPRGKAAVPVC